MSSLDDPGGTVDVLAIAAGGGALGLFAADVAAITEAGAPATGVPSLDLAALLGPGVPGAVSRRLRVAAPGAPPFDLVTDGVLAVRSVPRGALLPVPRWLVPLVAPLGAEAMLLEADALVLLVDPTKLAAMCALAEPASAAATKAAAPEVSRE